MHYVLVLAFWMGSSGTSVVVGAYETEASCKQAAKVADTTYTHNSPNIFSYCIPKGNQ